MGDEKLRAENERLRDIFKRSEVNWLKERQLLVQEIDQLREGSQGFRSHRAERAKDLDGKDTHSKVK